MKDDWSTIEYKWPDKTESKFFRKNLAPAIQPGSLSHPFVCYLTFGYAKTGPSGLPTSEDANLLVDIEESEIFSLENEGLAILVGVVFGDGIKDFIFYSKNDQHFNDWASQIQNKYPNFEISFLATKDLEWSQYHELPSP